MNTPKKIGKKLWTKSRANETNVVYLISAFTRNAPPRFCQTNLSRGAWFIDDLNWFLSRLLCCSTFFWLPELSYPNSLTRTLLLKLSSTLSFNFLPCSALFTSVQCPDSFRWQSTTRTSPNGLLIVPLIMTLCCWRFSLPARIELIPSVCRKTCYQILFSDLVIRSCF